MKRKFMGHSGGSILEHRADANLQFGRGSIADRPHAYRFSLSTNCSVTAPPPRYRGRLMSQPIRIQVSVCTTWGEIYEPFMGLKCPVELTPPISWAVSGEDLIRLNSFRVQKPHLWNPCKLASQGIQSLFRIELIDWFSSEKFWQDFSTAPAGEELTPLDSSAPWMVHKSRHWLVGTKNVHHNELPTNLQSPEEEYLI